MLFGLDWKTPYRDSKGTIHKLKDLFSGGAEYELPVASASTLGGVKIGESMKISESGVINTPVKLGYDTVNDKYGYYKEGESTLTPFEEGGSAKIPIIGASGTQFPKLPAGDYSCFLIYTAQGSTELYTSDFPVTMNGGTYGHANAEHPIHAYILRNGAWELYNTYTNDIQLFSANWQTIELANYALIQMQANSNYVSTKYSPAYLIDYFDKEES